MKKAFIFLLSVSLLGCVKEREDIIPAEPVGVKQLDPQSIYPSNPVQNADGYFSLTSYNTHASQDNDAFPDVQFSGILNNAEGQACVGLGKTPAYTEDGVWMADLVLKNCNSFSINQDLVNVSGTDITLRSAKSVLGSDFKMNIYMPEKVRILSPAFTNGQSISPGATITWTKDVDNPTGDVLVISYQPESFGNEFHAQNGYPDAIVKQYLIQNNLGAYTLSDEVLADFPNNSRISVEIRRHNSGLYYNYQTDKQYTLFVGHIVAASFMLIK